jgi:hypothetical protein
MAEILENSVTNQPNLYERMLKNLLPSGFAAKRQVGGNGKTRGTTKRKTA